MVLDASELSIDVPVERISTLGMSWIEFRLVVVSVGRYFQARPTYLQLTTCWSRRSETARMSGGVNARRMEGVYTRLQ